MVALSAGDCLVLGAIPKDDAVLWVPFLREEVHLAIVSKYPL